VSENGENEVPLLSRLKGAESRLGFSPFRHFAIAMKTIMKITTAAAEVIHFTVEKCALGLILVAQSAKGLSAITLGDDRAALLRDLERRFPTATRIEGGGVVEASARKVIAFMESPARGLDVPLDARGTQFQQGVWEAIGQIPPGSTASYTEIARRMRIPKAARAVAGACAANAIAVAIPCHRVVRSDGRLSGYRWGVERKRALLDAERAFLSSARSCVPLATLAGAGISDRSCS